jgi:membrane protease YdiL (CAAX protease family)
MPTEGSLSKSDWRAILVFYILACAWSWPFFWWRDAYTASWDAWHFPRELKECFIQWGPGLAAITVYYLFPHMRPRFLSLAGSSWTRSLICFLAPILLVWIVYIFGGGPHWASAPYYLAAAGFSCMGEEAGWRGFLQGALRPFGRIRGSLLVALMWTVWHFNPTRDGLISHLEVLLPVTVVVTFFLAFLTGRTGSLLLAAAVHEWLDIGVGYSDYRRWVALAAVPFWLWIAWKWPKRTNGGV